MSRNPDNSFYQVLGITKNLGITLGVTKELDQVEDLVENYSTLFEEIFIRDLSELPINT